MRQVAALLAMVLTGCATGGPALDANGNAATLKQAQELRRADRAEQAAAVVQRALLTTAPGNVAFQGELARDLIYSDPRRALDLLAEAFDPVAPDPKLLMIGGVAQDVLGDHVAAQRMYADALKITPNDSAILHNLEISKKLAVDSMTTPLHGIAQRTFPARAITPEKPKAAPVVVSAPDPPAPTFRERWRLL